MKRTILAAVLLAGIALATPASAATLNIDSVTGTFDLVTGSPSNLIGLHTNTINWGIPAIGLNGGQSGYQFIGVAAQGLGTATNFNLGTLTHFNQPIEPGTSITGATLNLVIQFNIDGGMEHTLNSQFLFAHNETPNNCNCSPGDNDIVTALSNTNLGGSTTLNIGGTDFVFAFTGFQIGGVNFAQFSSPENNNNIATLRGSFVGVASVPGPVVGAGIPGILAALGLAGFGWRRRYHQMFA